MPSRVHENFNSMAKRKIILGQCSKKSDEGIDVVCTCLACMLSPKSNTHDSEYSSLLPFGMKERPNDFFGDVSLRDSINIHNSIITQMVDGRVTIFLQYKHRKVSETLWSSFIQPATFHNISTPLWVHFLERQNRKDARMIFPDKSLPSKPSHIFHECNACAKKVPFSLLQLFHGKEKTGRSHLFCGKKCKKIIAAIHALPEAKMIKDGRKMTKKKKIVASSLRQHVAVDSNKEAYDRVCVRLKKRIEKSRELTIFLSSSVPGLLIERQGLVRKHFPWLVALCESKGVHLNMIDPSWVITSDMARNHLTVKTCLDAVRDSDIFIGFYGQRYGVSMLDGKSEEWLKPALERCYGDFPWLKQHQPVSADKLTTNKSLEHLEFELGYNVKHEQLLSDHEDPQGPAVGYAFFRNKEYDDDQILLNDETEAWKYQTENSESGTLLERLRIDTEIWAQEGRGAFYTYSMPKDCYDRAFIDLCGLLQMVLPSLKDTDDSSDFSQVIHLERLTRSYAGNDTLHKKIENYIAGEDSRPFVITSNPGGGKSTLLANAIMQQKAPNTGGVPGNCIYYFIGIHTASQELENVFDSLQKQVVRLTRTWKKSKYYSAKSMNEKLAWVVDHWAQHRQDDKLLIVIDGLNELLNDPYCDAGKKFSPHDLQWLMRLRDGKSQPWPPTVKLIVSSLGKCDQYASGRCLDVLVENKNQFCSPFLKIQTVSVQQCEAMIQAILKTSRKQMDGALNLQTQLTELPGRANPLFITIFVHELMLFSSYEVYDELASFTHELLQAKDVETLLDSVFARLERTHVLPFLAQPESLGRANNIEEITSANSSKVLKVSHSYKCHSIDPGDVIQLPKKSKTFLVVRVCSSSEFELMESQQNVEETSTDDMVLIQRSLVAKVLSFLWASKEGLLVGEVLALLKGCFDGEFKLSSSNNIQQLHLTPLLGALHRMLSKNTGLIHLEHESVRKAVESRYFAFSKGRIRTLQPRERKIAEQNKKVVHKQMAEYFKTQAEHDDMSDIQEQLPRPIREKIYHESISGEKPSFLVCARVRPFIERETREGAVPVFVEVKRRHMCSKNPQTQQAKVFTMDCCISEMENQEDVWRRVGGDDLVSKALDGFNVTIMAYGQTGSGKTHTMFGNMQDMKEDEMALISRTLKGLLSGLDGRRNTEHEFHSAKVELSIIEIYNDTVRDLRGNSGDLRVFDSCIEGLSVVEISSREQAMEEIDRAYSKRVVKCTRMNNVSSRSHCIIRLRVQQIFKQDGRDTETEAFGLTLTSVINMVDLAGSERGRTRKANQDGSLEAEAIAINKSLRVLNQVISNLANNKTHAPFRESKLTRLLHDSLGGNAFTVLIVNLSPSPTDYSETLNTLEYARSAKMIQNKVVQNAEDILLVQHARVSEEEEDKKEAADKDAAAVISAASEEAARKEEEALAAAGAEKAAAAAAEVTRKEEEKVAATAAAVIAAKNKEQELASRRMTESLLSAVTPTRVTYSSNRLECSYDHCSNKASMSCSHELCGKCCGGCSHHKNNRDVDCRICNKKAAQACPMNRCGACCDWSDCPRH